VVALLNERFVCVRLPELCTKDLIPDPRDVPLLERLHEASRERGPLGGPGFWGGEREAFLSPAGELLDVFLSLGTQGAPGSQFLEHQRERPDLAVERFFDRAAAALRALGDAGAPRDLAALRDGSAPAVAAARRARPAPGAVPAGRVALRVSVRNDRLMYGGLVGDDLWLLAPADAAALVPDGPAGAERAWPGARFLELAHRAYPRGHVAPRLDDASVGGEMRAVVERVDGDVAHGRFTGELCLAPTRREELGARKEARTPFTLRTALRGDFAFDRHTGRFLAFRLASQDAVLQHERHAVGPRYPTERYDLGVELAGDPVPR
jgi:hypothetical protein